MNRRLWTLLTVGLFAGCDLGSSAALVAREPAPDGRHDLVVTRDNGGATTDFVYEVYITHRGEAPSPSTQPVFAAHRVDSLCVRWTTASTVRIAFQHATIGMFTNAWTDDQHPDRTITIRLVPRDTAGAIRPGRMHVYDAAALELRQRCP